jgi:hypothetical protein
MFNLLDPMYLAEQNLHVKKGFVEILVHSCSNRFEYANYCYLERKSTYCPSALDIVYRYVILSSEDVQFARGW